MKVLRFLRNHQVRISQSQLNDIVAIVARRVDIETWVPKEETPIKFVEMRVGYGTYSNPYSKTGCDLPCSFTVAR